MKETIQITARRHPSGWWDIEYQEEDQFGMQFGPKGTISAETLEVAWEHLTVWALGNRKDKK